MIKVIQIKVGGFDNNFSYLIFDSSSKQKEAILIDSTGEANAIEKEILKHKIKVIAQLFTHAHPDHCELIDYFELKGIKSFKPKPAQLGFIENLTYSGLDIKVIHTPGHTKECVCFLIENNLFTGDTLFVKGVGTTNYGGNESELNESLAFISTFDKNLTLWPGHNYGGASSKLGEAITNAHLRPSKEILETIKKKVIEYESKLSKKKF
ncbi:MAG: MBL fold metallo-hydrolase [archaeon]|jgi:glyoxylase-like metal-dependent hydrolase (beta-lactamase superfamily II)